MKKFKKYEDKSFEEVLKELDDMIIADMKNFKELLNKMSVRENTDELFEQELSLIEEFENSENISNLADNDAVKQSIRTERYYV
jgi:hypothetical protein